MEENINSLQGTLVMDAWSSKKRKHLTVAVLFAYGKSYLLILRIKSIYLLQT